MDIQVEQVLDFDTGWGGCLLAPSLRSSETLRNSLPLSKPEFSHLQNDNNRNILFQKAAMRWSP